MKSMTCVDLLLIHSVDRGNYLILYIKSSNIAVGTRDTVRKDRDTLVSDEDRQKRR